MDEYEISPAYQPFALPNYDLTQLEQQDRNALVEVVDKGAKNEFEFGNFTPGGATVSATISDYSVTVTGASSWAKAWRIFRVTKSTAYVLSFRATNVATVANPQYRVSLGNNHHSGGSYYGIISCDTTGNYDMIFTPPADTDIYLIINPNYTSTAASDTPSITVDNIMICTEEEYKISPAYQPYTLPNSDLTQLQSEDRAALAEEIDAGAKNEFIFGEFDSGSNANVSIANNAVTVSGTQAWAKGYRAFKLSKNTKYVLSFEISQNDSSAVSIGVTNHPTNPVTQYLNLVFSNKETGKYSSEFTAPIGTDIYFVVTVNNSSATPAEAKSITVSNIMVCTKAAFCLSPKFVPYRYDPYTTAWQNIANGTLYARRNGRTVTINGYVDNVSFTAGSATSLGTINNEIGKPVQQVRAICSIGLNAYTFGEPSYITIGTDGNVVVTSKTYSGTGTVFFSVSYTI
jgi:hypothetical protein